MGNLDQQVANVLATHLGPADQVEFYDYGAIQGGSAAKKQVKRAFWQVLTGSSTSGHKAEDYLAAAVTNNELVLLPVKFKTGMTGMSFKPVGEQPIRCPRHKAVASVSEVKTGRGHRSVRVQLTLPDGTTKEVDFFDNPDRWGALGKG